MSWIWQIPTPSPSDPRYHLESQIRECYGRCAYTHKIHEKMAERLATRQWLGKWANSILSALITGGSVTTLFKAETGLFQYADNATAILSILSLIFNAYLKDLDPGALAQRHRETASDMWNVRESDQSLIADALDTEMPIQSLRDRRDGLQAALNKLYLAAPFTDDKAYAKAKTALKDKEDLMFSEKEIDDMLPHTMRRAYRRAAHS
ncbi:SLATT domain-containing protein [Bosea sp. 2RAB26]|uniref:SLATT domain-containing protein n=1 Tax=Bosea sp. 2RAB26 TaxID=3237476 RepID=UPI003F8E57D6